MRWIVPVAAAALGIACRGRDDLDGRRAPIPGLPAPPPEWRPPAGGAEVAWDWVANRAAIAGHLGGALVVDCGGPDVAKYIEAPRSSWHLGLRVDGVAAAAPDGLAGELQLPVDGDPGGVARSAGGGLRVWFYARSAVPDQLVSVFFNEHRLRDVALPRAEWAWYGVDVPPSAIVAGDNKLRFYFRAAADLAGVRTAAAFATIAVGAERPAAEGPAVAFRAGPVDRPAGRAPALSVTGPSRLSAWLRVPADAPRLVVAPAGDGAGVAVAVDGEVVWRGVAEPDWAERSVDLSRAAGALARIDLLADGPVAWGRPAVVRAPAAAPDAPDPPPRPDVIVVWTISSLRGDRVSDDATPTLARLAREGLYAPAFVAASSAPAPAHVALLTGRYPDGDRPAPGAPTLGARLAAAGYATALVSGNGFVHDEAGFARGFARYENPMRRRQAHGARALWHRAKRSLPSAAGRRAFVYVATVEPHLPYVPSDISIGAAWGERPTGAIEPARTAQVAEAIARGALRPTAGDREWLVALYDASVRDADAALAAAIEDLRELDLLSRTAIVVVGDHGEELFEDGRLGHGHSLSPVQLLSPLIVWYPARVAPRRIDEAVDAVDVYATVLDLAGVPLNPEAQGRSLLAASGGPAFARLPGWGRAVVAGGYAFVVPRAGPRALYDLRADPAATVALDAHPRVVRWLRGLLGLHAAYERAWRKARWGTPDALAPAFAADHGR